MNVTTNFNNAVPFARSYWVVPGKLLAGYYPGDISVIERERKLQGLPLVGIRFTINLMEEMERKWYGEPFAPYHLHIKSMSTALVEREGPEPLSDVTSCAMGSPQNQRFFP